MPQRPADTNYPKQIKVVKEDGKFVLKDENGFYYDRGIEFKDKKAAEVAAHDWNNYYSGSLVQ